jgi:hypothetical protein
MFYLILLLVSAVLIWVLLNMSSNPPETLSECQEGDKKIVECNSCTCNDDGSWICTQMNCRREDGSIRLYPAFIG